MHIKNGDLILGTHDLDHVLGDINHLGKHLQGPYFSEMPGSEALLVVLDDSGELHMSGLETDWDQPIRQQLESLGVKRIVIRLDQIMVGPVDLAIQPEG